MMLYLDLEVNKIETINSFDQASLPDGSHISKLDLLKALVYQRGRSFGDSFLYDDHIVAILDDPTGNIVARYDGDIVCDTCIDGDSIFYDGAWFAEVEKYRPEIERSLALMEYMKEVQCRRRQVE